MNTAAFLDEREPLTREELLYSGREKRALHLRALATVACMVCAILLAAREPRLVWFAVLFCTFSSIRYTGYIHALNHAWRPGERVPLLLELLPHMFTPLSLGFTEFQWIHLTHHRLTNQEGDPDLALISGPSRLLIFVKCAFTFEHWFFYTVARRKLSPRFWPLFAVRLALCAVLCSCLGPTLFLIWLGSIKLGTALSFYVFSYRVHEHHGERGIFRLPLPRPLERASWGLIGKYAAQPANFHDLHHRLPWVSCTRLDLAARGQLGAPELPTEAVGERWLSAKS